MLAELLRTLRLQAPPWARRLGLAREQVAITYRYRRQRKAWASHLDASREVIVDAIKRCRRHRRAWIIGAGDAYDVPVAELAKSFDKVVLTDVVVGPELRRWQRRYPPSVRTAVWDATGALPALAGEWRTLEAGQVERLFATADAGVPPGGEPDLVVSANCISQLGIVPVEKFPGDDTDDAFVERCGKAAAQKHLEWLAARTGVRVLIGDCARLDLDVNECEIRRELVPGLETLRKPDRTWLWRLAPIPEFSRDFHRVHLVGAWIDG